MPYRLFYISASHVDPCGPEPRNILDLGTLRNARLDVTGLLCCSGAHFAQILEGPPQHLAELMTSIRADPRHTILTEWPAAPGDDARWFRGWALAYLFDDRLERLLARLLHRHDASLHEVTRELMQDVDLYQSTRAS
jgi:hypothetical protein